MPTIPDLIGNLLEGIASHQDVVLTIAVACGILLLCAGVRLVSSVTAPNRSSRRVAYGLLIGTTLLAILIGVPSFIPYPHVDYLVPGVPFFPICLLVGLLLGFAFFRLKEGQHLATAFLTVGALALVPVAVVGTTGMLGMGYTPNLIWAAYPLPAIVAGALLAWAIGTGRRYYTPYVLAWTVVVTMVAMPSYIGTMYGYQATLESATSAQGYFNAPEAALLIDQSTRGELFVSAIYVASVMLLLCLPLVIMKLYGRPRAVHDAPGSVYSRDHPFDTSAKAVLDSRHND